MKAQQQLLFISSLVVTLCQAGRDAEDLIAKGYTCKLVDYNQNYPRPGVEVICDDGICAWCVKTHNQRSIKWTNRETELDAEDLIAQGYVCGPATSNFQTSTSGVEVVCDDGHCAQCTRCSGQLCP